MGIIDANFEDNSIDATGKAETAVPQRRTTTRSAHLQLAAFADNNFTCPAGYPAKLYSWQNLLSKLHNSTGRTHTTQRVLDH
ncbi:hypothetical protein J6590_007475 [Homalodisca vitripennis]|nr:hypothetical protein J6590_007475 [Homalodisca vitripennis]